MQIYRGDVYWYEPHIGTDLINYPRDKQTQYFDPQTERKCRPWVVVSSTKNNKMGTKLFLVPLTTQPQRGGPLSPTVVCDGKQAWANTLDLLTLDKSCLSEDDFICQLNKEEIASIEWALAQVLGMHRPRNES